MLTELFTRIKVERKLKFFQLFVHLSVILSSFDRILQYRDASDANSKFEAFHPVLSVLSYLLKVIAYKEKKKEILFL